LIEVAIVITISALLIVPFVHLLTVMQEKQRMDTTKTRMEALRVLLTNYAVLNERLPCPASPQNPRGSESLDLCAPDSTRMPPGIVVANAGQNVMAADQTMQIWIGVIPTRELRITADDAVDGWGDPFTYAVSRNLTLPKGMHGNPVPAGHISITDGYGGNLLDKPDSGRYVILSHGPDGDGGWSREGARMPCKAGTLAARNCLDNGKFVVAPWSRGNNGSYFDHLVVYDGLDSAGRLVDRIAACGLKREFYVPAEPDADGDGCVADHTLWHGACLQVTTFHSGAAQAEPAQGVLDPATAQGTLCGCNQGYKDLKISAWAVVKDKVISVDMSVAGLELKADKNGKITGNVSLPNDLTILTELHTCIQ
jgi:hypothetical protein